MTLELVLKIAAGLLFAGLAVELYRAKRALKITTALLLEEITDRGKR